MKHVKGITKHFPSAADEWQDVVCIIAHFLASLLPEGSFAFIAYIDDKCDLPQPNP